MESQSISQVISTYQHSVKTLFWISRKKTKILMLPFEFVAMLAFWATQKSRTINQSPSSLRFFSPTAAIRLGVKIGGGIPVRKAKESILLTKLARDLKKFLSV